MEPKSGGGISVVVLDRGAIAELCRQYGVRRLAVFGSAVSDRFDPERSDVDFLVEFDDDVAHPFRAYFDFKAALEALLERPVDLVEARALRNPYVVASIQRTAEEVYAA